MLFANPQMLAFSIAGGVLSWAIMGGGAQERPVLHHIGIGAAAESRTTRASSSWSRYVLSPTVALVNAPVLAIAGMICGLAIEPCLVQAVLSAIPQEATRV